MKRGRTQVRPSHSLPGVASDVFQNFHQFINSFFFVSTGCSGGNVCFQMSAQNHSRCTVQCALYRFDLPEDIHAVH